MQYYYQFVFRKGGALIYISHLDMMRLFHRASRRAQLPVALTQGFNPRLRIKFERALKLGVASDLERGEMILTEKRLPEAIQNALRFVMPEGIEIKEVVFTRSI